jgi:hypothetical protein
LAPAKARSCYRMSVNSSAGSQRIVCLLIRQFCFSTIDKTGHFDHRG